MRNIGKCVFIIIGTLIGAGFASGQEIASFFNRFGEAGLYGNVIASLLFGVVIAFVLISANKKNINTYNDLICNNKVLLFIIQVFLYICFCVMISGVGAFFNQQFGISQILGSAIGASICLLVFSYRFKGLEVFNTVLVPFIILGILLIGFGNYDKLMLNGLEFTIPKSFTNSWLLASVLYVSYNSLVLVPILITFKSYKLKQRENCLVALLSFVVFGLLGVLLFRVINMLYPEILAFELPTLKLAEMMGPFMKAFYGVIILSAIFTTAISCGFAFLEMKETKYNLKAVLICATSVVFSSIGFSELVNTMFPIFGYLGILQLIVIIYRVFRKE